MAAGQSVLVDEDGAFPDWLEIHHDGAQPIDLAGWHLTDHAEKPTKWTFPSGTVVAGGGYLVVFCSEKNRAVSGAPLHTNFRLNAGGETLRLIRPDGTTAHTFSYPVQFADLSYDGTDFLGHPTPGAVNDTTTVAVVRAPQLSVAHGFFTKAFGVQVTSPTAGATVRYTTDGTEPTITSPVFPGTLNIQKTTCLRVAAFAVGKRPSPVVTATYLFLADVVKQSPDGKAPVGWPKTWGANRVDYGMDPRIAQKGKFAKDLPGALKDIPSISLVLPLTDLFDPATGIYANPEFKGREWERAMSMELINPDGSPGFQINAGLRIRGGASRSTDNPKHNLRILMKEEYGAEALEYPLFGPGGAQRTQKFDLRSEQLVSWVAFPDENADFIRDIYGRDTQRALGQPSSRGNFYHLYLNGQYWGLYQTDERIGAEYAAEYFGGSESDYDTVKINYDADTTGGGTDFVDGSFGAWRRAVMMGVAGFESAENYFRIQGLNRDGSRNKGYERLIDVDNLIDYMLAGIYIAADDSPPAFGTQNNWYAVRSRKGDFGFRFFAHDWEISMMDPTGQDNRVGEQPTENPFKGGGGGWPIFAPERASLGIIPPGGGGSQEQGLDPTSANPWHFWQAMRMNPEFRLRVADHVQRFFFNEGVLTQEKAVSRWRARMEEIDQAIIGESARWGDGRTSNRFIESAFANHAAPGAEQRKAALRAGAAAQARRLMTLGDGQDEDDLGATAHLSGRPGPGPKPTPGSRRPITPYTRDTWLKACNEHILQGFLANRSAIVLQHLKEGQLYPAIDAPALAPFGGTLPAGETVAMTAPLIIGGIGSEEVPAEVYFTTDGNDPRVVGGAPHADAQRYVHPIRLAKKTTLRVRARNQFTGEWSALVEAVYLPGVDLSGLKLTEIHYHPSDAVGSNGEFVEFQNTSAAAINLAGLKVTGDIAFVFPAGSELAPGAYAVLARNAATFAAQYPGVTPMGIFTGRLPDSGGRVSVETADGARVLSIKYDDEDEWPVAADGFGFSLVYHGSGDPDDGKNWKASYLPGGTPGRAETQRIEGSPVVIHRVGTQAGLLRVEFKNLSAGSIALAGSTLIHQDRQVSLPATSMAPGAVLVMAGTELDALAFSPGGGDVAFQLAAAPAGKVGYVHRFHYGPLLADTVYGRVKTSDGREYFPKLDAAGEVPAVSSVRVAEIHYFPGSSAVPEFVELENLAATAFDLSQARLEGVSFQFPAGASVPAQGRALVVAIDPTAFRAQYEVPGEVPIYGPASGNLQDNGERVALEIPVVVAGGTAQAVVEELRYNDRHPWPVAAAGLGHSLQRFAAPLYSAEPLSWGSGEPTPGRPNKANAAPAVTLMATGELDQYQATVRDVDSTSVKLEFVVDGAVREEKTIDPRTESIALFTYRPTNGIHDLWVRATDDAEAVSLSPAITLDASGVPDGAGDGLRAEFFANPDLAGSPAVTSSVPVVGGDWFHLDPAAGVSRTNFSVRYHGQLVPRLNGEHTFNFRVTGGLRFYVDGELVIDEWSDAVSGEAKAFSYAPELVAGQPYDIVVEYFDTDGLASLSLVWTEAGSFFEGPIPVAFFYQPDRDTQVPAIAIPGGLERRLLGQKVSARFALTNVAIGSAVVWSQTGGTLPPGLELNAEGKLSGTPTEAGSYAFELQASTMFQGASSTVSRQISIRVVDRGVAAPVVRILQPAPKIFKSGPVLAKGTVKSSRPLAKVRYALNGQPWHDLPAQEAWSVLLTPAAGLAPGLNILTVQAEDVDGRSSTMVEHHFSRQYPTTLTVTVSGAGTVTRGFLGQSTRIVGQDYTITATPAPGYIFAGWADQGNEQRLRFTMSEGLVLTANFVPNVFAGRKGVYTTLLGENETTHRHRGRVQLSLNDFGEFTGTVDFSATRFRYQARLDVAGRADLYLYDEKSGRSVNLALALDTTSGEFVATVNVAENEGNVAVTGSLESVPWGAGKTCSAAGRWNIRLPKAALPAPQGHGFATLTVSARGAARMQIRMADGKTVLMGGALDKNLRLPVYAALGYDAQTSTGVSLSGPMQFTPRLENLVSGPLLWASAREGGIIIGIDAQAKQPRDLDAENDLFAYSLEARGSRYWAPKPGQLAVNLPSANFTLSGPDGSVIDQKSVRLNPAHVFIFSAPNSMFVQLAIDPGNGVLEGQFRLGSQVVKLRGILDQEGAALWGFYLTPERESGAFEIEAATLR